MTPALPKTHDMLRAEAKIIANLIVSTQIDQRARLFEYVAEYLRAYGQGYTSGLFRRNARES